MTTCRLVSGGLFASLLAWLLLLAPVSGAQDKDKEKLELSKIPKKVMDVLKAKFTTPEITKWTKEKDGEDEVYDIEFTVKGRKFEADIREDGSIVNWEKEIAAKDLPRTVTQAVEAKYPKSTLKEILEITDVLKGGKEKLHGYEIILQTADRKEVEVTVAPDGKILEDTGTTKEEKK